MISISFLEFITMPNLEHINGMAISMIECVTLTLSINPLGINTSGLPLWNSDQMGYFALWKMNS